jgi:uncharacterized protein YjbJ (UPF0337 family)
MKNKTLKSRWKELKADVLRQWAKLTDSDVKRVRGNSMKLAVLLQEKYGYSKEEALSEVDKWVDSKAQ